METGDLGAVEGLITDASQTVALECNGVQLGGAVEVEGVLTDGLQGGGEHDHFQRAVAEGGFLDDLQGSGQLDILALESVECADLNGLNTLGDLEDTLVLDVSRAVEQGLAVQTVQNTVLILLHLRLSVGKGDGLDGVAVGKDGFLAAKEGGHAEGQLNRFQRGTVLKDTGAHDGYGVSDLEAGKGGVAEHLAAEGGDTAIPPIEGGQLAAGGEGAVLNDGNVVGNSEARDLAAREGVRRNDRQRGIYGQDKLDHIRVAAEGSRAHILHPRQGQCQKGRIAADGVVPEAYGRSILVELDHKLGRGLRGAVLGLACLGQTVDGVAVDGIQMRGKLDTEQGRYATHGTADSGVRLGIRGDGVEGTDGQQGLTVIGVGLVEFLKYDRKKLRVVEGSCANHVYVRGNRGDARLGSGTVNQKQTVALGNGTDVQDAVDTAVEAIGRMNVDGVQNGVTLENGVDGVVVVGLVVGAQLGELRGKVDHLKAAPCKRALADGQRSVRSIVVREGNRRQRNRLEGVVSNVGNRSGEGDGGQDCVLKGRITDVGQAVAEIDGGQRRAALECARPDGLQRAARGYRNGRQGGDVCERIRADVPQINGKGHGGQLGILERAVTGSSVLGTNDKRSVATQEGQGSQLGVCECAVADIGHGGGDGDRGQAGVGKGSGADGGQILRQLKGGDHGVVEYLSADSGGGGGQGGSTQLGAAVEGLGAHGERLGVGGVKGDGRQSGTTVECALADLGELSADGKGGDTLVVLEYACADLQDLIPGQLGQIAILVLGVEQDLGQTLGVENTVLRLEVGIRRIHLDARQGDAIVEDGAVECGQGLGKLNGLEDDAAVEDRVTEGDGSLALAEGEGQKRGAILEGRVADVGGGLVDLKGLQGRTHLKGVVADGQEGCGVVDLYGGELDVVLEGVAADGGNVDACAHAEGGQRAAVTECGITHGDLASGLGAGTLEVDQRQGAAVLECAGTDIQSSIARTFHNEGGQVGAALEGVRTDAIDIGRNHHGGDGGIVTEYVGADTRDDLVGSVGLGGSEFTVNGLKDIENGQTGRVCVTEVVIHSGVDRAALLHQDGGQRGQGIQHAHVFIKGSDASGKLQQLDVIQTVERAGVNGHVAFTAGGELNSLQGGAIVEGVLGNGGDGLGNDHLRDGGVVECMRTNGVHRHIVHHLGEGVGAGLRSGEDLQIVVAGGLVKVDQRAVVRAVEALVGAFLGHVHLEGLQLGAVVEGCDADMTDGVGQRDRLQIGAVLERVVRQLGDLDTLIGGGDADLGDGINLGACLNRVGAVGQKLEGQNVGGGIEEGIYVQVIREGVGSQTDTLLVGDLGALTVCVGVPALEEACVVGRGGGNGQVKGLVEYDGLGGTILHVGHDLGIHVEDDLILVSLPVGEQDHRAGAVEHGVGVLLAVALGAVGEVVPAVEGEAAERQITGKGHGIARGQILGDLTRLGAAHVGDGVGVDLHGRPVGAVQIGATNLDDVQPRLGQHDLGGVGVGYDDGLAAVYAHLKARGADDGRPADGIACIGQRGNHLVVTNRNGSAVRGSLAVLDGADRDLIDLSNRRLQTLGLHDVEGVAVYGEGLVPDLYLVGGGAAVGPRKGGLADGEVLGNGGSRLVAGSGGGLGGEVTLGDGSHGDGNVTREVCQAEGQLHDLVEGLGVLAGGDLHGVVSGVGNGVPDEGVLGLVVGQPRHGSQNPLVNENGRHGRGVALCYGGDGEADTALLHGAVTEVVVGGFAVVVVGVAVAGVTALDGEEVALGVLDRVEDQSAVYDRKGGHAVQGLVAEVAGGDLRGILCLVGHGGDLNDVVAFVEQGKVYVLGGGAQGLVVENRAVGSGDLQLVGRSAHHGVPLHRGGRNGDLGRGKLIALGGPYGVKGGVCGQHRILGELGGQLLALTVHTGEPAVEHVALTQGSVDAVELAADGGGVGNCLGALVAKIKADGVFGGAGDHLRPAGVEHGVGVDEGRGEVEGGLETLVGVPTQKHESVLLGIGGLGGGLTVHDLRVVHHTAAVGVIADGEADLLAEGHDSVAKGQSQGVAVQRGGGGALLVLVEVE